MPEEYMPIDRHFWKRFVQSVKNFVFAEQVGHKALWLFAVLFLFLFGINGLNVFNSYVGRDFMTAIENRNMDAFMWQALLYLCVFAASTFVSVIHRYVEERLGMLWREWLTRRFIIGYANDRVYYRLKLRGEVANPEQRIADAAPRCAASCPETGGNVPIRTLTLQTEQALVEEARQKHRPMQPQEQGILEGRFDIRVHPSVFIEDGKVIQ